LITRTAKDVGLKLPEAVEHEVKIAPTPKIRAFLELCKDELSDTLTGKADAKDDSQMHIFSILSRMDNVAAYPPLQGITDENPKADALIGRVMEHYKAGGNQIIFVDRKEAHAGLKDMLAAAGIPADQIAVFNADETADVGVRLKLQEAYNEGKLRVVLGGSMISEGMDLQMNTTALHFMNLSWESQTIHQRKGRGIRQGNTAARLDVYFYLLEGSTDAYRRAVTSNKSHWWEDLRRCQTDTLTTSLVASPIEDGLLISLARDPDAAREKLKEARAAAALRRSSVRAGALMRQMLLAADPLSRPHALSILQRLERTLRGLEGLAPESCDTIIARVEQLAHAVHVANLYEGKRLGAWQQITEDFRSLYFGPQHSTFRYGWKYLRAERDAASGDQRLTWLHILPPCIIDHCKEFAPASTWLGAHNTATPLHLDADQLAVLDGRMEVATELQGALTSGANDDSEADCDEDLVFLEPLPAPALAPHVEPVLPAATKEAAASAPTAQQSLLSIAKPVAAPTPTKPVRSPQERVMALMLRHAPEDIARELGFPNSFALTKWVRSGKGAPDSFKLTTLARVELEFEHKRTRQAG
jgi:hypothetical protein